MLTATSKNTCVCQSQLILAAGFDYYRPKTQKSRDECHSRFPTNALFKETFLRDDPVDGVAEPGNKHDHQS